MQYIKNAKDIIYVKNILTKKIGGPSGHPRPPTDLGTSTNDAVLHAVGKDNLTNSCVEVNNFPSNESKMIFEKRATDILKSAGMLVQWVGSYVSGNLPEIGQSALCVDLEDGRVFREYEPCGEVTPKDENTVIVSVFSGQDAIPENEEEKRQMMWKIEREARTSLLEALIERDMQQKKENELKLEQTDEQGQGEIRGGRKRPRNRLF